jgi:hypothetical protein
MSKFDPNSVYDTFKKLGHNPNYENRKAVYYGNYGFSEYYRGSPEQNERMNKDIKRGRINFNYIGARFPDPY